MLIINQIIYNFNYQKLSWFSVFVFFKIVVVFTATGIDQIHSEETGSQINWQIYRYKSYWTTKLYKKVRRFWFMLPQSLANLATTKHLNLTCTIFFKFLLVLPGVVIRHYISSLVDHLESHQVDSFCYGHYIRAERPVQSSQSLPLHATHELREILFMIDHVFYID